MYNISFHGYSFVNTERCSFHFLPVKDCNALSKTGQQSKTKVSFCSLTAYGTVKIQPTVYPFSLFSHVFLLDFFISMHFFWSYHLAATFISKDFYLLIFLESLVSFEDRSRAISFFLSFLYDCTRSIYLQILSRAYNQHGKKSSRFLICFTRSPFNRWKWSHVEKMSQRRR